MIRTVIFDFDGTVADTMPVLIKIFNGVAEQNNLPVITTENIDVLRNSSASELLKKYKITPIQLIKFQKDFKAKLRDRIEEVPVYSGVKEMLDKLNQMGIQTGIVTSNNQENVEKFLNKHRMKVSFIHGERNIFGKGKVLRKLIKRLKLLSDEVIYVGDEVRDIEAARDAGIKCIAVTWGFNSEERLKMASPDWLITHPRQVFKALI